MSLSGRVCQQCGASLAPSQESCGDCGKLFADSVQSSSPSLPENLPSPPLNFDNASSPKISLAKRNVKKALMVMGCVILFLLIGTGIFLTFSRSNTNASINTTNAITQSSALITPQPTPQALFSDDFSDNSNNWDVGNGSGYASSIANNILTMSESNHTIFRESLPSISYNDFLATITFTLTKADQNDSVGIYLRAASDHRQGYYIDINGDNTYDIIKISKSTNQNYQAKYLAEPAGSSSLQPIGHKNTLSVVMKGSSMVLIINNTVVQSLTDSDFTAGTIFLFVENGNTSSGVEASFDSIAIYPAPDQLPG